MQLALTDKRAANEGEEHDGDHKGKALVRCPPIAASDNPSHCRIECFDIIKTFPNSVHDTIDILATTQGRP